VQINGSQIEFNGTVGSGDALDSGNYVAATSGWKINGSGDAEFNNVVVRGNIGSGGSLYLDGDIKTSDGKFTLETSGITLKKTASDTTTLELIQDTAQIIMRDASTQRVQIIPTGNIRLDTDAGIPIDINSTSDADCVDISTAQPNRRGIVATSNPGSASSSFATIHVTNSYAGGYAVYAGGKVYASGQIVGINGLNIIGATIVHDITVSGDMYFTGVAVPTLYNLGSLETVQMYITTIRPTPAIGYLTLTGDVRMDGYDILCEAITCDDIICDDLTVDKLITSSGDIEVQGNLNLGLYDLTCDDITCDDLTVDAIYSASGKIEINNSLQFTSGSYGLHFNNDGTNTVLYSNGTHLYFRDSGGTTHTLV